MCYHNQTSFPSGSQLKINNQILLTKKKKKQYYLMLSPWVNSFWWENSMKYFLMSLK